MIAQIRTENTIRKYEQAAATYSRAAAEAYDPELVSTLMRRAAIIREHVDRRMTCSVVRYYVKECMEAVRCGQWNWSETVQ